VQALEAGQSVTHHSDRLLQGKTPSLLAAQDVAQGGASDVLRDQGRTSLALDEVEDANTVGMVEPCEKACLLTEMGDEGPILGDLSVQDLDGHSPLEKWIVGEVDGPRRAASDSLSKAVPPGNRHAHCTSPLSSVPVSSAPHLGIAW
jgi:hypothetical protein